MPDNCEHPNRTVTEVVAGLARHTFKEGVYDTSIELIETEKIVETCPECGAKNEYDRGSELPQRLLDDIQTARSFVGEAPKIDSKMQPL